MVPLSGHPARPHPLTENLSHIFMPLSRAGADCGAVIRKSARRCGLAATVLRAGAMER
jgi:hypothetical protein